MVDQNLLTIFIAITALAVLIQSGILIGLVFVTTKLSRQADRAMDSTGNLLGSIQHTAESLQVVAMRLAEFSGAAEAQLRHLESWWKRRAA